MTKVVNYWILNEVYVLITALILIGFLIAFFLLFIRFQIHISKELNTNCENPIAIYFDKESRDRCLTEKITKKNELAGANKSYDKKDAEINQNLEKLYKKMAEVEKYYDAVKNRESPEINNLVNVYSSLTGIYDTIDSKFRESKETIDKLSSDFETSVNANIQLAVDVGNNLVDTLISNTYTKKWKDKRKKMVDTYDKIKKYLNNPLNKPYLEKADQAKLEKINQPLPKKARTG